MDASGELVIIGVDEEDESPPDVAQSAPGMVLPVTQGLFWESDEEWKRGGEAGRAHGAFVLTRRNKLAGSLTFSLERGDLVATGVLRFDGEKSFADGTLALVGGTGEFRGKIGEVHVEARNPKRYRINTADG
jgi:hypothetical protein